MDTFQATPPILSLYRFSSHLFLELNTLDFPIYCCPLLFWWPTAGSILEYIILWMWFRAWSSVPWLDWYFTLSGEGSIIVLYYNINALLFLTIQEIWL